MTSVLRGAYEALHYAREHSGKHRRWRPPSGESIKALRDRLQLNQAEFAAKFGLDLAALQNWEQERRTPEKAATVLLSMIEQEPNTVARLVSKARHKHTEFA